MRIILDECLPRKLLNYLVAEEIKTVPDMGWAGIKNGELIQKIKFAFDVFITIDSNLMFQQNMSELPFGVVVIKSISNRLDDILPLVEDINQAIKNIKPSEIVIVEA